MDIESSRAGPAFFVVHIRHRAIVVSGFLAASLDCTYALGAWREIGQGWMDDGYALFA